MSQYTHRVPVSSLSIGPVISKSAFDLLNVFRTAPAAAPPPVLATVPIRDEDSIPEEIMREVRILRSAGFGAVPDPQKTKWGWGVRMQGLILPGGSRTDALVLLPASYPLASPIGFYLKKGANVGGLDTNHLYQRSYHGSRSRSGRLAVVLRCSRGLDTWPPRAAWLHFRRIRYA